MKIKLKPVAFVKNKMLNIYDDKQKALISEIVLADYIPKEALFGIDRFSHLEIIFFFHQVKVENAIAKLAHPRNDKSLPKSGTFAVRSPNRPNRIGLTTVEFIELKDRSIIVKNLDAINGTPVLDIKPVVKKFGPKGEIKEPNWVKEKK